MQLGVQIVVENPEELEAIRRRFVESFGSVNPITDHFCPSANLK